MAGHWGRCGEGGVRTPSLEPEPEHWVQGPLCALSPTCREERVGSFYEWDPPAQPSPVPALAPGVICIHPRLRQVGGEPPNRSIMYNLSITISYVLLLMPYREGSMLEINLSRRRDSSSIISTPEGEIFCKYLS